MHISTGISYIIQSLVISSLRIIAEITLNIVINQNYFDSKSINKNIVVNKYLQYPDGQYQFNKIMFIKQQKCIGKLIIK